MDLIFDRILRKPREKDPVPDLSDFLTQEDADELYIPLTDYDDFVNITGDSMTGKLRITTVGFNAPTLEVQTDGETMPRGAWLNRADIALGDGANPYDTFIGRALPGVVFIEDSLQLGGSFVFQGGTSGVIGFGFFEDGSLRLENNYSLSTDEFYIDILDSVGVREQLYRAFTSSTVPINYIQFWGFESATGSLQVGGGFTIHDARLAINQDSTTRAVPVLYLAQADVSEEMIEFVSTEGAGNAISDYSSLTLTPEELIKVTVNGATRYLVSYSGA